MIDEAKERLAAVHARIASAAKLAGRDPWAITLIAVSKTHDGAAIRPLLAAGQTSFGENRVQEAQAKWPTLLAEAPLTQLHLVGQLQSNKVPAALALFGTIHSLDRPSLLESIARAQDGLGVRPACFIQVNIGDEPQKGGCAIGDLPKLIAQARAAGIDPVGLMAVPPEGTEAAPYFALTAKLARDNGLSQLSMGMSGDFETAIMLGATHIRIGTALFGTRDHFLPN